MRAPLPAPRESRRNDADPNMIGAFDLRAMMTPISRRIASAMVRGEKQMGAAAIIRLRLQPRPELLEIAIGPR